jgi:hypothetical protein
LGEPSRRKELRDQYEQRRPEAGVYRFVNRRNNRVLLGSSLDLARVRNKLEFARSTNSPSALDYRLKQDIQQFGIDSFDLEVLEVLQIKPQMTPAQIREELVALEALWRETLDPALLY